MAAVADLIELNGIDSDLPEIPVRVLSEDLRRVANPHFATASNPIGTDDIAERRAN